MADLTIRETTAADRPVLERLYQLYRHDLSEFRDSWPEPDGLFRTHLLPSFFDPDAAAAHDLHALLALRGDRPVGFALVAGLDDETDRAPDGEPDAVQPAGRTVHDFFVIRRERATGVAAELARAALTGWPGRWEIGFQDENPRAARFWRRLVAEVAGPDAREERRPVPGKPHLPHDVVLHLVVPPQA